MCGRRKTHHVFRTHFWICAQVSIIPDVGSAAWKTKGLTCYTVAFAPKFFKIFVVVSLALQGILMSLQSHSGIYLVMFRRPSIGRDCIVLAIYRACTLTPVLSFWPSGTFNVKWLYLKTMCHIVDIVDYIHLFSGKWELTN